MTTPNVDMPESPTSIPLKTARAAEKFWLVASIATTLYVIWTWFCEPEPKWSLGLFSVIAWLWYVVRRAYRKKLEASAMD